MGYGLVKKQNGAEFAPSQHNTTSVRWLAGLSLGLLGLTVIFVTGGFVSYNLGVSASQTAPAHRSQSHGPQSHGPQSQNLAARESGMQIVILPKSTRDMLGSAPLAKSHSSPTVPAVLTRQAEEATTPWAGPRVKPRSAAPRLAASPPRPVAKSIDVNARWLAPTDYVSFALERDFTGGQEALFTRYEPDLIEPSVEDAQGEFFLSRGETLSSALIRAGIRGADREAAIRALSEEMNVRRLQPGQKLMIRSAAPALTEFQEAARQHFKQRDTEHGLISLVLNKDALNRVEVTYNSHEGFEAETIMATTTTHYAAIRGEITDSLFASAERSGAPRDVVAKLANLFLFDIDFQREIRRGDQFEAVYEVFYDDQGRIVSYGDVIFGRMSWLHKSKEKGYYRYTESGKTQWFNEEGKSARRLLMKTPIEGARITSGFGRRRHPVLGYTKAHKGVDFGARRGTPIMAAGDGTVERANRFGSFGNYIKIRHANGYQTAYAHLKGFAKGVRKGARVRQGQVIGYVGTTGRSTGPHLHYEVLRNKKQINPMRIKVATGKTLEAETLDDFMIERDWINDLRLPEQSTVKLAAR